MSQEVESIIKPTKIKSKEKVDNISKIPDGIVLYSDAGARPNPGYGGWGFHGYVYSDTESKKGSGNATVNLTKNGYVPKADKEGNVTPLTYLDAYGTIKYTTNNGAEIEAAAQALNKASEHPVKSIHILTDSKYVVTGASDYLPKWKRSNWVKSDGGEVSNRSQWENLDEQLTLIKAKDIEVKFSWIKGHNGDQGNELADKYATIGVLNSAKGNITKYASETKADGYWSGPEDKHPFITHRRCYFTTNKEHSIAGEYYLGEHGKDDDLLGKRTPDGAYAYIVLSTPDPYIEIVRNKQLLDSTTEDAIIMTRLDRLYKPESRIDLMRFGSDILSQPSPSRLDLHYVNSLDKDPLTRELKPPRIAIRAVEAVNVLKGILLDWSNNPNTELVSTDITNSIYNITNKEYKLDKKFVSGLSEIIVDSFYVKDDKDNKVNIHLVLGLDIPDRNTFKRLEKYKPTVTLLTWKESPKALRYATVIKSEKDLGIWAGFYSNFKYLDAI